MGFTPLRPQQYRVAWPLTPGQVENIDTMFETLFKRLRAVDITASANAAGSGDFDGKHLGEVVGRFPESAFAGEDGEMGLPGAPGVQGLQGPKGNSGYDGEPGEDGIGFPGVVGATGPTGLQGFPGQDGQDGDDATGSFQPSNVVSALFTQGSVVFAGPSGRLAQNNSKLFWDNTNFRLGVGTAAPATAIESVDGRIQSTATTAAELYSGYGSGLDGTSLQRFSIYADTSNGWLWEIPKDGSSNKLDFTIDWRGGGTPVLVVKGATRYIGWNLAAPATYSTNVDMVVGLGTVTGSKNLDLVISTFGSNVDTGGLFTVQSSDISALDKRFGQIGISRDNTSNLAVNGKIVFSTTLAGVFAEAARFDPNGRLGIGQTSPTAILHLKAGTATASTAPLKFTSGTSLTSAEAGAMEFTTDDVFFTITTGVARKAFVLDNGARLTSGKVPIATTNGRLIDATAALFSAAGVANVVASTFEKAETGTDANVLTYTTNASTDEALIVQVMTDVSALTGTSIAITVTWKDSNNATATTTLTLSATGDGTINIPINAFKNTNVVVSTVFVGVSTAYNISAFITRLK